jgi:uncharacterized DUF497 family protein
MKPFRWSESKNAQLKRQRGVSFEDVVTAMVCGNLIDVLPHPNAEKYGHQYVYVVMLRGYAHLVPFVDEPDHRFLKTIIPSRKAHRDYPARIRRDDEA